MNDFKMFTEEIFTALLERLLQPLFTQVYTTQVRMHGS